MRRWTRAIVVGALALAPVAALAAIDGTHHDMQTYLAKPTGEKCAYCHSKTVTSTGTGTTVYGQTGTFCVVVCHDGSSLTDAVPTGPGYFDASYATVTNSQTSGPEVVAFSVAHGRSPTTLDSLDPDNTDGIAATGWPHTSATTDMECTSCHAVHDGTNPPFLNRQLGTGNNATAFCQACHNGGDAGTQGTAGRYEDIANMGAHPTEFVMSLGGTNGDEGQAGPTANPLKLGRRIEVKATLLTANPGVTKANFNTVGSHWNTGGHFLDTTDYFPTSTVNGAVFGCYSCHSAHQDQATAVGSNLLLATINDGTRSVLCAGCHGATGSENNPGLTGNYHPANDEAAAPYEHNHAVHGDVGNPNIPANGTFPIPIRGDTSGTNLATAVGAQYVGNNNEILCVTCHDVHGGVQGLMAIRAIDTTVSTTSSVCLACHQASTTPIATNAHHPGQYNVNYNADYDFPQTLGWATIDGLGDLTDGLSCPDCHVFQGNSTRRATAHNW